MKYFLIINIYLISCVFGLNELPSFLHVCRKDDPNLEKCMLASVEELRPYLVNGVPESRIPSLEPLILNDLFSEESAGLKITTNNVSAWGCSDFKVRALNMSLDPDIITIDIEIPKLRILAYYSVDGKILVLPIKGGGNLEANITDCSSKVSLNAEIYKKDDGEEYVRYKNIHLDSKIGGGKVRVDRLFNGDKVVLAAINDVVNKNFDMYLKEIQPAIEKALETKFLEISNAIVEPYTYNQLFPH